MDTLTFFIDSVLNIDQYLATLITVYGPWIYLILFLIIFCETGLIVTPFLPGDSLLFIAGTLATSGQIDIHLFAKAILSKHMRFINATEEKPSS